jgi:hypothetical protein
MGHKRVLVIGAIIVAAAIGVPTTAMLVPGGALSDAPPEPPRIEITTPVAPDDPPIVDVLEPVPQPTATVLRRSPERLDPRKDPVATPPPEQTPPPDPADRPPAAPEEPNHVVEPAPPTPTGATTPPAAPTIAPEDPDPEDGEAVVPPPVFTDEPDPADQ